MSQSLQLGGTVSGKRYGVRRMNRVPLVIALVLVVLFFAAIFYGLSSRGLVFGTRDGFEIAPGSAPASTYADRLKQGVSDGIIEDPASRPLPPRPVDRRVDEQAVPPTVVPVEREAPRTNPLEDEDSWRARLEREQQEQVLREVHRQRMASLQADEAAIHSPIAVGLQRLRDDPVEVPAPGTRSPSGRSADPLASAIQSALAGQGTDPNGQAGKEAFVGRASGDSGYLGKNVVPQSSAYELKRGSVIPATLVTGITSDLPGRVTAQVSQNVFDSATGRHLLIPQGTKLFGRYDSNVSYGQSRVLLIWTDIVFPNGSTIQIMGMPGVDSQGASGLRDKVNNHYVRTFGAAVLVALIGAGTEMMIPQDRNTFGRPSGVEDAARRSFAQSFGDVAKQTLSRNLDIQPTLTIRPGYRFNVLVEQDMILEPW